MVVDAGEEVEIASGRAREETHLGELRDHSDSIDTPLLEGKAREKSNEAPLPEGEAR